MKEKTAIRLADAVVAMLDANRLTARDVLEAVGVSLPKKYDGLLKTGYRAGFIAIFKEKPDPEADALARAFAIFEAMRTHPGKMRTFLKQRMKELPREPGGAPRKILADQELTVCAEIEALRSEYDTREAIRIVAAKRRVSERTIYRIWGKHHPKKKRVKRATT